MKITRKLLSTVLALVMICLLTVPSFALEKLYVMCAYYNEPKLGDHFPIGTVTSAEPDKYTASARWYYYNSSIGDYSDCTAADVMKPDIVYYCRIYFVEADGYDLAPKPEGIYYINGKRVTAFGGYTIPQLMYLNGEIISGVDKDSSELISSLAVTGVPTPIVGQTLSKDRIQVSEGFTIQTVALQTNASGKWAAVTDKVEADVNYRVYLQLNTVSGYTYADTITTTVNGNTTIR